MVFRSQRLTRVTITRSMKDKKEVQLEKDRCDKSRRDFISSTLTASALAGLFGTLGSSASAQTVTLNAMGPTPEQAQAFAALPDQPVVMVNLLKFKDGPNGEASYNQYGEDVGKILQEIGAEVIFTGECQSTFIGGAEWDRVVLVRYPNSRALLQMAQSAEYQAIAGSRSAGLEGQVNLAVFE